MNVRLARRAAAQSARSTGDSTVARLLLGASLKLVLLFAVSSSTPACVLPVAPEFQDPPGAPNAAPQILAPVPTWGAEVAATPLAPEEFQITVTDSNGDDLYIEWVVDGRLVPSNMPIVRGNANGDATYQQLSKLVTCRDVSSTALARHPVMAVVADRMFVEGSQDLLRVDGQGLTSIITWTLDLTCPASP